MFMFKLCCLFIILHYGYTAQTIRGSGTEPTISECAAKGGECDETKGRPVCGTDNQTYPTRCHLIRAQCSGHKVSVKYRGKCKAECLASRNYAQAHQSIFIPRCRDDGSYAPVQCAKLNTDCWCVNSQGKPIPNTTITTGKPVCSKPEKSNKRRSSPRNENLDGTKKQCTKLDRFMFNTNLIKMFHSEYTRYHSSYPSTVTDKIVLDWKFSTLDTNNNHLLDKNEYRELKRIVKKAVKPKRCARTFGKFCDRDHDDRLSRQEWGSCLTKDANHAPDSSSSTIKLPSLSSSAGNQKHHGGGRGGEGGGGGGTGGNGGNRNRQKNNHHHHHNLDDFEDDSIDNDDEDDDDYGDMSDTDFNIGGLTANIPGARVKPVFLLHGKPTLDLSGESDPVHRESDGESDCLADRAAALDEQKTGSQALYVPDCTPDGRYQRVQCYRSTGYCWCVHEDTGKNIPGTSTKDQRPQCDAIVQLSRPMKGCPDDKKIEFLKELKNFLKTQLITSTNTGSEPTNWKTEDEKIATLSFVILDKNKNKVWERSEWKPFRDSITSVKKLRKCGKKMPRYCDVNNDRKITLSEWMNCLETQRVPTVTPKIVSNNESKPTTFTTKLKGPNPLESYLKSDR